MPARRHSQRCTLSGILSAHPADQISNLNVVPHLSLELEQIFSAKKDLAVSSCGIKGLTVQLTNNWHVCHSKLSQLVGAPQEFTPLGVP
jgi:hypothetical protein